MESIKPSWSQLEKLNEEPEESRILKNGMSFPSCLEQATCKSTFKEEFETFSTALSGF